MMRALAALALASLAGCDEPSAPAATEPRVNVLLVTIDTLRADHLSCYGYERETSPHLDALAAEGLRFTRVSTPRAKTTPAMATLLSGLYPHDHGVRDLVAPLDEGVSWLLQEQMRANGWTTGAIVGNYVLTRERSGLDRGFDLWVDELPDVRGVPPNDAPQRTARSMTDGALEALGLEAGESFVEADKPWFLWVHYMDPHGAYAAPEEHRIFERASADPIPRVVEPTELHRPKIADYNVPGEARLADGGIDAARVRDLYDAEIHYVDAEIGRLLDRLRAAGLYESTLILVTSDHGESLGEHLYWFEHGTYAYEATCRVPLIVRPPDVWHDRAAPGVRDGNVSLADLRETITAAMGWAPPRHTEQVQGGRHHDLFKAGGAVSPGNPVFMEKVERADLDRAVQIKAVRLGDWKLIRRYAHVTRGTARELVALSDELYDLGADPHEAQNLADQPPPAAPLERLREELLRFAAADESFPELDEILRRRREALERDDPEALRALEALGY
jgi:arylsulfatase